MKLVSYCIGGDALIGLVHGDQVVDVRRAVARRLASQGHPSPSREADVLVPNDLVELLNKGSMPLTDLVDEDLFDAMSIDSVKLLPPLPRPGKIIGVGRNYGAHAAEAGLELQEQPRLFVKLATAVAGPNDPIRKPALVRKLDWEVELAVVVGRRMRDVTEERALDFVAGYMVLNDLSAREFQFDMKPPQTTFAKSMDGFCPIGPCLLTADDLRDPGNVELRCWVNGALMQQGNTRDMIFSVPYILSYISNYLTLEPGDIVATGTPEGSGAFRKPPIYLKPGDRVRMEIPPIGVLDNTII